ncbi:MAG: hypothetical protein LBQ08_00915 [Holosporaceae bacterium]|jgi:hypothetical protein|nr:hypothetical protein [Holosporaceae bacterium]
MTYCPDGSIDYVGEARFPLGEMPPDISIDVHGSLVFHIDVQIANVYNCLSSERKIAVYVSEEWLPQLKDFNVANAILISKTNDERFLNRYKFCLNRDELIALSKLIGPKFLVSNLHRGDDADWVIIR